MDSESTANSHAPCDPTRSNPTAAGPPSSGDPKLKRRGKRKHAESTSGSNENAACPTAIAGQVRPTRQRLMHAAWAELLPADLIGTLGTFLDAESVFNFAISTGPALSRVIRKAYLWRNFSFLSTAILAKEERKGMPLLFSAFLEANDDWKEMYDNPGLISSPDQATFDVIFREIFVLIGKGNTEVVKHMVEARGIDINRKLTFRDAEDTSNSLQIPPLFAAIFERNLPVLEYLVSLEDLQINATGVFPDVVRGRSALHKVMEQDDAPLPMLQLLLSRPDINVNIPDMAGRTPLHFAAAQSNLPSNYGLNYLRLLLAHKDINVNATDERGLSPLHYATMLWDDDDDCERSVKCLVDAGANPQLRDRINRTPLDYANQDHAVQMKKWIDERNP